MFFFFSKLKTNFGQNDNKEENKAKEFGTQKKLSRNHRTGNQWQRKVQKNGCFTSQPEITRRDNNSGSNVVEIRGRMETKADGEVQSKDLAFAVAASTDDCNICCCIQRMIVSGVQKARTTCNRRSWSSENLASQNRWCASSQGRRGRRRKGKETRGTETMELTTDLS